MNKKQIKHIYKFISRAARNDYGSYVNNDFVDIETADQTGKSTDVFKLA